MSESNTEPMDFGAIIDRECPTPIQWNASREYMVRRVNAEFQALRDQLATANEQIKLKDEIIANDCENEEAVRKLLAKYDDSSPNFSHNSVSLVEEVLKELANAHSYIAGQDLRSDFRTAADMRAALDRATAERDAARDHLEAVASALGQHPETDPATFPDSIESYRSEARNYPELQLKLMEAKADLKAAREECVSSEAKVVCHQNQLRQTYDHMRYVYKMCGGDSRDVSEARTWLRRILDDAPPALTTNTTSEEEGKP